MAKGKRKGSAKPKSAKGDKSRKGGKVKPSIICSNCRDKEGTENRLCEHYFCKDCFDNLTHDGVFRCSVCEDASVTDVNLATISQLGASNNSFIEKLPPIDPPTPVDFSILGKGIKKLTSFTHLAFDTVERIAIDKNETFVCVNPVQHKIYLFKDGKCIKGVKYLFNHGFTGGLSLTYDSQILVVLQGSKFTSICFYTSDAKFRKSSFFQKGAYSHSIDVGTNNTIFALDAENCAIHFFNRERKMCQSWTLQSASAQGIDLWNCSICATKDNKLMLFDASSCQLYEVVNDDEIVLRVSFTEENSTGTEQSGDSETESIASLPPEVYDSMWTKRKLSYTSDDEKNTESEDDMKTSKVTSAATFLQDILEDSENTTFEAKNQSNSKKPTSAKSKKGKKAKGGKKKKGGNANKNNNANGEVEESGPQVSTRPPQSVRKEYDPRKHPSLLVLDKYDCLIVAHHGKIALFSPDGQYIKSIVELAELDDQLFKITIKCIIPFGENKLAVLWHKHGGINMYRFVEVYSYKTPRKYKRIKSSMGRRKFTYDVDPEFEKWMENNEESKCCVIQ